MLLLRKNTVLIFILLAILLLACEESVNNPSIDYVKQLNGKWLIDESLSTNGPICYFLDKGNEISFEVNASEDGLFFNYFTGDIIRRDYFKYTFSGKKFSGIGNYNTNDLPELLVDTTLTQYLEIEFLSEKRMHCKLKLQVFSPITGELVIGDVSNFYAVKP